MSSIHGLIDMKPVLQSSAESTIREYKPDVFSKGCWGCGSTDQCFQCTVLSSMSTKPQLPISIAQTLPTIPIKLGQSMDSVNPGLEVIVDTGSVICVALSHLFLRLQNVFLIW